MEINIIDKIFNKLEKLDQRLDNVDKTLVSQHESLKHHIYRTDLAEQRMDKHETDTQQKFDKVQTQFEPIKKHVNQVDGALKLVGIIATVVAIASGVYALVVNIVN